MDRLRRSHRGFTLTELLVVLAILGILAAATIPHFAGSLAAASLNTSARELIACARIAHSRAVTTGVPVRLVVDLEQGRFRIEERRREPVPGGSLFVQVRDVPGASGELRKGVRVELRESQLLPASGSAPGGSASGPRRRSRPERRSRGDEPRGESVLFRPDGTTERREFLLRDLDGFGLCLRLRPATGGIEIERLPREGPPS